MCSSDLLEINKIHYKESFKEGICLDLTFVLGDVLRDTKVRLPAANSTFQRKTRTPAAATRVQYKIVHKK